jgi:hypothetical protein
VQLHDKLCEAFDWQVINIEGRSPAMAKNRKWIGANGVKLVFTRHNKTSFGGDRAKFSYDKFDFGEVVVI